MATITAPPAPPANFYAAKAIRGSNNFQLNIFGYPIPNYLSTIFSENMTSPITFLNQTTLFDVSSLTENHEVIVVGYSSPTNILNEVNFIFTWRRSRDDAVVFELSFVHPAPAGPGSAAVAWIGWLSEDSEVPTYPLYKEIQENGNYYVTIAATGGQTFSQTINFAVKGIPPSLVVKTSLFPSSFSWTIRLSDYFVTSNYIRAGICADDFVDGQSSPPTGIIDSTNALPSTISCVAEGNVAEDFYNYGVVYGFAQAANGLYYKVGKYEPSRPPNWSWSTPLVAGELFNLTAADWNAYMERVDDFWEYRGNSKMGYETVFPGDEFKYTHFNSPLVRLFFMNPAIQPPDSKYAGAPINASDLNRLRDSLNSIS